VGLYKSLYHVLELCYICGFLLFFQIQKIQGELRKRGWDKIKVGAVEEFQGQENRIIIVSTVRSNPSYLSTDNKYGIGFLQNDKVSRQPPYDKDSVLFFSFVLSVYHHFVGLLQILCTSDYHDLYLQSSIIYVVTSHC
jgi:hypothetical protein